MVFENYLAVILLVITSYCYGFSLDYFFKFSKFFDKALYKHAALVVIGFSFYSFFIYLVGFFGIPLYMYLFFIVSLIIPIIHLVKSKFKFSFTKPNFKKISVYQIAVVILSVTFFYLMITGAFSYPWLEDDDPWAYAAGASYVANFNTYHSPAEAMNFNGYLFPFSHSMLTTHLGLLNQVTPDLYSIMKIFIVLALLFGVVALFLFAYIISNKNNLFATSTLFFIIVVPSFAGHFIFNYTLSVVMFLIFLLSFALALKERKNIILAGILCATILITHPIGGFQTGVILGILAFVALIKELIEHKNISKFFKSYKSSPFFTIVAIGLLGLAFSFVYYGDFLVRADFEQLYERGGGAGGVVSWNYTLGSYDIEDKTLRDFFVANSRSRMDQQEGIGTVLFSLCLLGLLLMWAVKGIWKKHYFTYAVLFLFYFLFLWIFTGGSFNFSVQNYRWWSFFAIFVALHAAATMTIVAQFFKKEKWVFWVVLLIIFAGVIYTSAIPRYEVQRNQWPPGVSWSSEQELSGYVNLRLNIEQSKVLGACYIGNKVLAANHLTFPWEQEVFEYSLFLQNTSLSKNTTEVETKILNLVDTFEYEYLIIDTSCARYYGPNLTTQLADRFGQNERFEWRQEHSNPGFFLFEVV